MDILNLSVLIIPLFFVAAAFILVNSISRLIGVLMKSPTLPNELAYRVIAAIAGARMIILAKRV